jgi:hypothetical protein
MFRIHTIPTRLSVVEFSSLEGNACASVSERHVNGVAAIAHVGFKCHSQGFCNALIHLHGNKSPIADIPAAISFPSTSPRISYGPSPVSLHPRHPSSCSICPPLASSLGSARLCGRGPRDGLPQFIRLSQARRDGRSVSLFPFHTVADAHVPGTHCSRPECNRA